MWCNASSNYRPISLLPILGKIFEKIIFSRLSSFIQKYKIIYDKQYGFQSKKSTEHALLDIQQNILTSLENNEKPCCVFLDFAKAFDTVNNEILLQKLNHYGIRGNTVQLIRSYVTDREQCVQVSNTISDMDKMVSTTEVCSDLSSSYYISMILLNALPYSPSIFLLITQQYFLLIKTLTHWRSNSTENYRKSRIG